MTELPAWFYVIPALILVIIASLPFLSRFIYGRRPGDDE